MYLTYLRFSIAFWGALLHCIALHCEMKICVVHLHWSSSGLQYHLSISYSGIVEFASAVVWKSVRSVLRSSQPRSLKVVTGVGVPRTIEAGASEHRSVDEPHPHAFLMAG